MVLLFIQVYTGDVFELTGTGNQTKLGQNKHVPHIKWTQADQFINQATVFIFCVQLIIMFVFGIAGDVWSNTGQQKVCTMIDTLLTF
jgi:hypothetical protein